MVDAGEHEDRNLAMTEVRPEGTLVEGVSSRFDVAVTNHGTSEASDVRVKFSAGGIAAVCRKKSNGSPPAKRQQPLVLLRLFRRRREMPGRSAGHASAAQGESGGDHRKQGEDDRLPADSVAYYPARMVRGIPALIVDGDPMRRFRQGGVVLSQTVARPNGPVPSGVAMDIVTESEMESLSLDKYGVIFLCNVYRLGDKTLENIDKLRQMGRGRRRPGDYAGRPDR